MKKIFILYFFISMFLCESKDFIKSTQDLVDDNQNQLLGENDSSSPEDQQQRNYKEEAKQVSYDLNLVPDDYPYFVAGHQINRIRYPRYLNNKIQSLLSKSEKSIQGVSYQDKMIKQKQKIFKKWKDLLANKIII